jgi:hypothetical protein
MCGFPRPDILPYAVGLGQFLRQTDIVDMIAEPRPEVCCPRVKFWLPELPAVFPT